ncbi:MAG: HEPN domain-containing protein [Tateyamaria sp.]|uniref:HEPN domain-containing protein n=1 Tax=Tateyamaria sp. TaxID=1929288 RepID=UPI0032799791
MPNFDEVISNRKIRALRHSHPYRNLRDAADQCKEAGRDLLENATAGTHSKLLERSVVITFVTHVEVYFRDMLDAIFRQCSPDFFVPKLKQIHNIKYDIEDLIDIYKRQIHPLELVSSDASFQNTDKIEKTFSKFLGKSVWGEAIGQKIRIKDRPETTVCFEPEYLNSLKRIFSLRHELVHNPRQDFLLNTKILKDIDNSDGLLLAVDVVLCQMLAEHVDPELIESGEED